MASSTYQDIELSVIVVAMFALLLDVIYLVWALVAYDRNEDSILEQQLWLSMLNVAIAVLMFIVLVAMLFRSEVKLSTRTWFLFIFAILFVATVGGLVGWALNEYYRKGSDIKDSIIVAFSIALVSIVLLGFLAKGLFPPPKKATEKAAETQVAAAVVTPEA